MKFRFSITKLFFKTESANLVHSSAVSFCLYTCLSSVCPVWKHSVNFCVSGMFFPDIGPLFHLSISEKSVKLDSPRLPEILSELELFKSKIHSNKAVAVTHLIHMTYTLRQTVEVTRVLQFIQLAQDRVQWRILCSR